jgi:hypothetical protein
VGTFFKRLLIFVTLLGLAGVTVFLLSQENARTFTLEVREGKLVVLKGRLMPMGADPWRPPPELVDTYAPLDLKGTQPYGVLHVKFTDRDELDRALFSVIEGLAKPRVASDNVEELNDGLYYLRRADRLSGLTDEQKISLKQMKSDVAFYSARMKLEDAQKTIEEALVQLRMSTETNNRHSRSAYQMLTAVEPQAKTLVETLRKAVIGLSAPAGQVPIEGVPTAPPGGSAPQGTSPQSSPDKAKPPAATP